MNAITSDLDEVQTQDLRPTALHWLITMIEVLVVDL